MGTFEDDVDYDRTNSFLDTTGYGFAVSVTHRAAATGTQTAIKAVVEEQFYAIFDDREVQRFHVNPAEVTVNRNDQIIYDGDTWTVVDLRAEGPELLKLTCAKTYDKT